MISIIMAYYQRRPLLDATLRSINKFQVKPTEVVIVDDASPEPLVIEEKYGFEVVVHNVKKYEKTWINPGAPYNIALSLSKGDRIVVQNPECYHHTNVLAHVQDNLVEGKYFSYACYSLDKTESPESPRLNPCGVYKDGDSGWYNHSAYRPKGYHFCSAIMRNDVDRIGGLFNPVMFNGLGYDDDELLHRVYLKLKFKIVDEHIVLHQYHDSTTMIPNREALIWKNKELFLKIQSGQL